MNFNNGPGGYHLPPDLPSARLPVEDQGVWGGALGQGYEGHPGDHEERGGVRGGGVGPGGYHLPPVLSAPSAHLPGEDHGVWGGALGQAYVGHPGDHGERGGVRGGGVMRWGGVVGGNMPNPVGGPFEQVVDTRLHHGRWVGGHVGEGGQQGYPEHWNLGGQQQAGWQDRRAVWGGGIHNQSYYNQLETENRALRHENNEMIGKIRSKTEEMDKLKYELEMSRMEIRRTIEFSDKTQDDLIALRSEMSRRLVEYEGEILKLQEAGKKWRIKVQKFKSASCKQLTLQAKIVSAKETPKRFSFTFKRQDSEQQVEKNNNDIVAGVEKGDDDDKQQDESTSSNKIKSGDDGKEEKESTLINKINIESEEYSVLDDDPEKAVSFPLTHRQKQIKYLEERDDLATAEETKLDNLKEQEMCWIKFEMDESLREVNNSLKLKVKTDAAPASITSCSLSESVRNSVTVEAEENVADNEEKEMGDLFVGEDEYMGAEFFDEDLDKDLEIRPSQSRKGDLEEKYQDPEEQMILKNLLMREEPIFEIVHGSIPLKNNTQLSLLLHSGKDPEKLIKLIKATPEEYKKLTGKDLAPPTVVDGRKDRIDELSQHIKSDSWMKQLGSMYRKIAAFVAENPEFRLFDWVNASSSDVDFVLGYFILNIEPAADNRSLGTRFTPGSLKQIKTGLQNLLSFLLKRSDKIDDFKFFMGLYIGKRNKYALVPQDRVQGERKRKLIRPEDQALRDIFLTQDVDKVEVPEDLQLIVGTALLEADVSRGTAVLKQIRREYISVQNDDGGKPMIVVKGNVRRKTMTGNSKVFKPLDFKIRGECEVKAIRKLLDTLPAVGCHYCTLATPARTVGEDKSCVCLQLFLSQRDLLTWRCTDKVWFTRQKWSDNKLDQLTKLASKKAGTAKAYTNGSIRPTNITNFTLAGLTSDQLTNSFNLQQNSGQQEKYKRLGELMDDEQKRMATMVNTPSGRTFLRGGDNQFGSVQQKETIQMKMYDNFKNIMNHVGEPEDTNEIEFEINAKVFAKIYGFPPWPAQVLQTSTRTEKCEVVFQNGSVGKNANVSKFTQKNFEQLVKTLKFKKSGSGSKAVFLHECGNWGLNIG